MTTRDPGARLVFTQGFGRRPLSAAFLASRPAASMTWGLEVLVQLVMAATTTWPSSILAVEPSPSVVDCDFLSLASAVRNAPPASLSETRSWGRDGPAMLGTTVDKSS